MKIQVDYSDDSHHDQLVLNNSLHLCLSILNQLGFSGDFHARTFGGKFAKLALNARNIVRLISLASNTPLNLKEKLSPLDEPEVVDALAGCAKWGLDLISWLTDSCFALLKDQTFMGIISEPRRFHELSGYLQSKNEVSLHLLLCSSTRGYLSACCRRLLHLDQLSIRAIQFYDVKARAQDQADGGSATSRVTPALSVAYRKLHRYTSSSLVKVTEFERLVAQLGSDIRAAYQGSLGALAGNAHGAKPQPQQQANSAVANDPVRKAQAQIELDMLLAATPPVPFREVLLKFFNQSLRGFRTTTDPAKLFFADYSVLEADDDPQSLALRRAKGAHVDVFKRVPLTSRGRRSAAHHGPDPGGNGFHLAHEADGWAEEKVHQWRRCVRCAAVMEDAIAQRPGFTFVLAQQRKCPCGGNWGLLPRGGLVN